MTVKLKKYTALNKQKMMKPIIENTDIESILIECLKYLKIKYICLF